MESKWGKAEKALGWAEGGRSGGYETWTPRMESAGVQSPDWDQRSCALLWGVLGLPALGPAHKTPLCAKQIALLSGVPAQVVV